MNRLARIFVVVLCTVAGSAVFAGISSANAVSGTNASGASAPAPVTAAVAPFTVVVGGATPADAAPDNTFDDCQTGYYLCFWQNAGYTGTIWKFGTDTITGNEWHPVPVDMNDRASSLYNHRLNASMISKSYPPSEPDIDCVSSQSANGNLANFVWDDGSNMNDSLSGYDLLAPGGCD
jgi:Peptidase inhibitor family I36